jgi:hypothetical protein
MYDREIKAFEMLWHPMPDEYEHLTDRWQMPKIEPLRNINPTKMMAFDEYLRKQPSECGVHCFKGDYLLERIWKRPIYYGKKIPVFFVCYITRLFGLSMYAIASVKL